MTMRLNFSLPLIFAGVMIMPGSVLRCYAAAIPILRSNQNSLTNDSDCDSLTGISSDASDSSESYGTLKTLFHSNALFTSVALDEMQALVRALRGKLTVSISMSQLMNEIQIQATAGDVDANGGGPGHGPLSGPTLGISNRNKPGPPIHLPHKLVQDKMHSVLQLAIEKADLSLLLGEQGGSGNDSDSECESVSTKGCCLKCPSSYDSFGSSDSGRLSFGRVNSVPQAQACILDDIQALHEKLANNHLLKNRPTLRKWLEDMLNPAGTVSMKLLSELERNQILHKEIQGSAAWSQASHTLQVCCELEALLRAIRRHPLSVCNLSQPGHCDWLVETMERIAISKMAQSLQSSRTNSTRLDVTVLEGVEILKRLKNNVSQEVYKNHRGCKAMDLQQILTCNPLFRIVLEEYRFLGLGVAIGTKSRNGDSELSRTQLLHSLSLRNDYQAFAAENAMQLATECKEIIKLRQACLREGAPESTKKSHGESDGRRLGESRNTSAGGSTTSLSSSRSTGSTTGSS